MKDKKLDFIGFGALNLDQFYQLHSDKNTVDLIPLLKSGGERMGTDSERERILKIIDENSHLVSKSGGGQAANTSVALSRMGFSCGFIGKAGNDEMGDLLLNSLENVDKSHIQRGGNSGLCLCLLEDDGDRANLVFPGCNDDTKITDADINYARNSRVVHIASFCNTNLVALQLKLLRHLQDTKVTFDPGEIYSRLGIEKLKEILEYTTVLFSTSEELEFMTGKTPRNAAKDVLKCGTEIVVWKKSSYGSEIITSDSSIPILPVKVNNVVDKTGAGDVYAAGFIAGLLMDMELEKCGKLGSAAAAMSITGYGRDNYPDEAFLDSFFNSRSVL
ncbi:hypothetical protein GF312_03455 [Candidatus Poribacteria bacterium]|nr:hypothetical protein [Candidatus Poribacteria bacterium]